MLFLHEYVFARGLSIMAITAVHNEAKFYKSEKSIILFPIKTNVLPFDIYKELCYALQAKVSPLLHLNFVRANKEIQ